MKVDRASLDRLAAGARVTEDDVRATPAVAGRPHVCFVSMNLYPILDAAANIEFAGGGEVQQAVLARLLRDDGFTVSVLTGDHGQPPLVDIDGIQVHRVPSPVGRGIKGLRIVHPLMSDVVAGLRRIDPDIVYYRVAGYRAAAAAWYARTHGKRFVYACASDREFQDRSVSSLPWKDAWLFRAGVRWAHGVLVQNAYQRELLRSRFQRDAVIVPNCFSEPDAGRGGFEGPIIWVGTFKPVKRPELFIELARRLPSRRFVMIGGADNANDPGQAYHRHMRELAAQVPNLYFAGYVPYAEVGRRFDDASVLVNTSDSEGFPNTFLQAWIRGVPTLSFVKPEVSPGKPGTIVCRDLEDMSQRLDALTASRDAWLAASRDCEAHFLDVHSAATVLQRYRDCFRVLCVSGGWR